MSERFIIEAIKSNVGQSTQLRCILFPCESNQVARALARYALVVDDFIAWIEEFEGPPWLRPLIQCFEFFVVMEFLQQPTANKIITFQL